MSTTIRPTTGTDSASRTAAMPTPPKDVVAAYYAAFNRRDFDAYARLFSPDCALVAPGVQAMGIDALRQFDEAWIRTFAESRVESLRMSETGSMVLTSNWFHGGAHVAPLQTPAGLIPASGASFSAPYCAAFEVAHGVITSQRVVFDADNIPRLLQPGRR